MITNLHTVVGHHRQERDHALKGGLVRRQLASGLQRSLSSSLVKVITGPRRAGKSTLAFQVLAEKNFSYLNFEDDALRGDVTSDVLMDALLEVYGKTEFLFFDEIQNYPNWESFVNKLHRRGYNLVLTGSNSRLLSRELGSALTGRHLAFELLPFGFGEFLACKGIDAVTETAAQHKQIFDAFRGYMLWGGFPEVVLGHAESQSYLQNLFDSVVLRDVVTRHRIRRSTAIHDLLTLLVNSAGNCFSARGLERALGSLSTATIQRYLAYCREAYLVQDIQPYFFKPRMRIKADRKIYAFDNGFVSAKSQPATSNNARLLENLVFVELVRKGFKPNMDLFYYRTRSGYEVDFLLRKGARNLELIQVTQNMAALKTRERELRALFQAAEELKPDRLTIVTLDSEERIREASHSVEVVPCAKWILNTP